MGSRESDSDNVVWFIFAAGEMEPYKALKSYKKIILENMLNRYRGNYNMTL